MPLPAFARRQKGAERKAAAEPFGERHDVGRDAGMFIGEELAGAAHARLHLVKDQQQAVFVTKFAHGLKHGRAARP